MSGRPWSHSPNFPTIRFFISFFTGSPWGRLILKSSLMASEAQHSTSRKIEGRNSNEQQNRSPHNDGSRCNHRRRGHPDCHSIHRLGRDRLHRHLVGREDHLRQFPGCDFHIRGQRHRHSRRIRRSATTSQRFLVPPRTTSLGWPTTVPPPTSVTWRSTTVPAVRPRPTPAPSSVTKGPAIVNATNSWAEVCGGGGNAIIDPASFGGQDQVSFSVAHANEPRHCAYLKRRKPTPSHHHPHDV